MASESVPYLARLRPLITAKLAVWGLVTRDTSGLDLAKLYPDYAQDANGPVGEPSATSITVRP